MNILSIDDHHMIRYGLQYLLKNKYPTLKLLEADNMDTVLMIMQNQAINIVLLDILMPKIQATNFITLFKKLYPNTKIILYSSVDDINEIRSLISLGADAYVNKNEDSEVLFSAIEEVSAGRNFISNAIKQNNPPLKGGYVENIVEQLSPREFIVLKLLISGQGIKEICNTMGLHPSTVSTYKNRLFMKLGVDNIVELIEVSKEYGLNS